MRKNFSGERTGPRSPASSADGEAVRAKKKLECSA
jgi:hypothetical protein